MAAKQEPKNVQKLSKPQLIQRVVTAIKRSGYNALFIDDSAHPAHLAVSSPGTSDSFKLSVYIWNLTHGGYPRDPNESRIQITGVRRFEELAGYKTLILGWSERDQIFAGFDVTRHRIDMTGRSPSFQIRRECLEAAKLVGIKPQTRNNEEIALAIRPDFFVTYVSQLEALHQSGTRSDFTTLDRIVDTSPEDDIVDIPPGPRKLVMEVVQRKVRDQRFRSNVMVAYQNRCAVSGIQLDLLDAAHIVPVEHPDGSDELQNGICLTAIHHRAFDRGLLGIKRDYTIVLNERRVGELRAIGWDGGLDVFQATLRHQINLPARREFYPDPDKLIFGQKLRGWTERQLS